MLAESESDSNSNHNKIQIQEICLEEYEKEILLKREQLKQINKTLLLSKELLGILRKKCVLEFYQRTIKPSFGLEHPMHPSMRNNSDDIKIKSTEIIAEPTKYDKLKPEKTKAIAGSDETEIKTKTYTAELSKKTKFCIVVGNTSKFVGKNKRECQTSVQSNLSYKWIVYVQMRESKFILQSCVKKMRFILDPSYRPNDIIDVYNPPYQVSRCGWGEFSVRIKIYFNDDIQQKPLELMHQLVLDKTLSGIHTMGAETMAEFWLPLRMSALSSQFNEVLTKPNTAEIIEQNDNVNQTCKKEAQYEYEIDREINDTENVLFDNEKQISLTSVQSIEKDLINLEPVDVKAISIPDPKHTAHNDLVPAQRQRYLQKKPKTAQVSLLKSNYAIHKQAPKNIIENKNHCIIPDHDYISSYMPEENHISAQSITNPKSELNSPNQNVQPKYCVENFLLSHFTNIKEAVEYLLQCDLKTDTKCSSIISNAQNEWLRAKRIQHLLRKQQNFIQNSETKLIWTVREIIQFARFHGYSKPLKQQMPETKIVQCVDVEKMYAQNKTLCRNGISTHSCISEWLNIIKKLEIKNYQACNIVHIEKDDFKSKSSNANVIYDNIPFDFFSDTKCLQNEISFIIELSKIFQKSFQLKEKGNGVMSPLAIFLVANVLRIFIKKLLPVSGCDVELLPYDICKVIFDDKEFEFLTNCYMGTVNVETTNEIKSETL